MFAYASLHQDIRQRNREQSKLDSYGAAMSRDPVKTPEEELIERDDIRCVLAKLKDMQPRVERAIRLKYGIGCEPHTLDQVGEQLGIHKERVRQLIVKAELKLKAHLLRKLRPERYRREGAERIRRLREEQARQAEWAAERAAEVERQAELRAVVIPVRVETTRWRYPVPPAYEARPYDPWASLERGFHLERHEASQVADMKRRLGSMTPAQLARLRDYVIENNLELMMKTFALELDGDNDA
jgi:hypothetical protein